MTVQIILVLAILAVSVVLLVVEWIPMEVVALLVLGSLALTGLVTTRDALSGFSNPAVVTVWAVFILSGGLTRTGVANLIGRQVQRLAGRRETGMIVVVMVSGGVMSAFMNNVAVAALMLPVVMDIARRTKTPPSRLLMPLAYGSLLGGLTTLIGTPPNLLVSDALRNNGLVPFRLFDFTPVGGAVMIVGIVFTAFVARYLLPERDVARESSSPGHLNLREQYDLRDRMFMIRVPTDSVLVDKNLVESRLGSALGLHILGIIRDGRTHLAPDPFSVLQAGDRLLVEGRLESMKELADWRQVDVEEEKTGVEQLISREVEVVEVHLPPESPLVGKTLKEVGFWAQFGLNVLAINHDGQLRRSALQDLPLAAGDTLLLQGPRGRLQEVSAVVAGSGQVRSVSPSELTEVYHLHERLLVLRLPQTSRLIGRTLKESHLGEAFGMRVLSIMRPDGTHLMPDVEEHLQSGDRLLVLGKKDDLFTVKGLEGLEIEREILPEMSELESARVGLVEAVLSPRSTLAGKTLRQLHYREKYSLSVLAIWREGRSHRTDLRDMALQFGDALLLYGPRDKLQMLGSEPDFLVLTQEAQETPRLDKAKWSIFTMGLVLVPVLFGLVPIYIAAVVGAALMVLFRCLTMEEAYRSIEWRAVFLIAGMLPLGIALDQTGAARLLAEGVVSMVGPYGPLAVTCGLMMLTFVATCFIPTAAVVVLMAPIVLNTCANMGLSPQALMMALAMAASASFMTPISHPANLLVMGPGGYRFVDYLKLGFPLSLLVMVVVLLVLPHFWPLSL